MPLSPNDPQPDVRPVVDPTQAPPLWLYATLLLFAIGFICVAFALQTKPDWPSLLLNLAAGLVGSVIILIFVDNRLRRQDIAAISGFPSRVAHKVTIFFSPQKRLATRYVRSLLISLQPLTEGKLIPKQFAHLEERSRKGGFVLRACNGLGKTTWTQILSRELGRKYLAEFDGGRIPIIFQLATWLPDRKLEDAIFERFTSFANCRRADFDRLLESKETVVLLDGYDELWATRGPTHRPKLRI